MKKNKIIPYILIIVSIVLIILGVNKGELSPILNKSIHICMECIGIG